jgi:sec-independent protein translocase protein TatB
MFGLGGAELVIVIILAIIFIGPKDLPKVATQLGRLYRQFKAAADDLKTTVEREIDHSEPKPIEVKKPEIP